MSPLEDPLESYRSSFERLRQSVAKSEPPALMAVRTTALDRFLGQGFPTTREEAWKYTSVAPIAATPFRLPHGGDDESRLGSQSLKPLGLGSFGSQIVFVNGRYSSSLSTPDSARGGIAVLSLHEALARKPELILAQLARSASSETNVFASLNTAFVEDGAFVFVPAGTTAREPIHLIFLSSNGGDPPGVSYPRTLIQAGRGSEVSIVESYVGTAGATYFTNAVTQVLAEEGSSIDHYKLQHESHTAFHIALLTVEQERNSRFSDYSFSLGGALSRNEIDVTFAAEGAECMLAGLFMAGGTQHMDIHTRIDHASPRCSSRELYKGVLDGQARGVFNGEIIVQKNAQKTDAQQTNKNLLLSRGALVDSTPQFRILANDVKCKHGSTTGQLDPTSVYYLRSRGIDEPAARSLLTYAFANDILQRVKVGSIRETLAAHLEARLPAPADAKEAVV